jgi:hypothetical protein
MEQTAVDFLIEELGEYFPIGIGGIELMVQKANEMFEQQIKDAYQTSHISMMTAEQYYNETFKQKP